MMEATGGFEPPNRGFADPRLKPLGYVAKKLLRHQKLRIYAPYIILPENRHVAKTFILLD